MNQNELYHFGVKGMKWGVRRYQNKDGSLTAAGKKREKRAERKTAMKEARRVRDEKHRLIDALYPNTAYAAKVKRRVKTVAVAAAATFLVSNTATNTLAAFGSSKANSLLLAYGRCIPRAMVPSIALAAVYAGALSSKVKKVESAREYKSLRDAAELDYRFDKKDIRAEYR